MTRLFCGRYTCTSQSLNSTVGSAVRDKGLPVKGIERRRGGGGGERESAMRGKWGAGGGPENEKKKGTVGWKRKREK